MTNRVLVVLCILAGFFALASMPAHADSLDYADATVTCSGYQLTMQGSGLPVGYTYVFKATFTATPTIGSPQTFNLSYQFVYEGSNGYFDYTFTGTFSPALSGNVTFSGTAELTNAQGDIYNTRPISFSPSSLSGCSPPPTICGALGAASNYAVLGLQNSIINLSSGPLRITGNAGIGQDGQFNFSGGGKVSGVLDADPTAQINISGGGTTVAGGIVKMSMAGVQSAALAEASAVASLTPTQSYSSITSSQTIVGNGGRNVIAVSNLIHLSGGNTLTIKGGPNDTFIFIIQQTLQLDGGSDIVLSGVNPTQVLFYFPATVSWAAQTSGQADTAGVFLAPNGGLQINGGTHNSEFISGTTLSFQSNPMVTQPCPN